MEHGENDFYRPDAPKKESACYSAELARDKEFSESIRANLKIIREQSVGLDELGEHIASIATALTLLRELVTEMDLEQLERRLASIASALHAIRADEITKELDQAS